MIKYFCDICEKPMTKEMLHVLTLNDVSKDIKKQKHLCTGCRNKVEESIKKIMHEVKMDLPMVESAIPTKTGKVSIGSGKTDITSAQIDALGEGMASYEKVHKVVTRLSYYPEWTMSPVLCEQFCEDREEYYAYIQNKCIGIDAAKVVALYKAGWAAKAIIDEIDFSKEDAISELIFCYEFTGAVPKVSKLPIPNEKEVRQETEPKEKDTEEPSNEIKTPNEEEIVYLVTPDYAAEYVSTLKNHKGISNETRVAIIKACCLDCSNKAKIAQNYDVTQPTVHRLFSEYIQYLNTQYNLGVEEPKSKKGDTPRDLSMEHLDEFLMSLPVRKDTNLDLYKLLLTEALTTDRSLSAIALQHGSSLTVIIKYLNKYADYLKSRS